MSWSTASQVHLTFITILSKSQRIRLPIDAKPISIFNLGSCQTLHYHGQDPGWTWQERLEAVGLCLLCHYHWAMTATSCGCWEKHRGSAVPGPPPGCPPSCRMAPTLPNLLPTVLTMEGRTTQRPLTSVMSTSTISRMVRYQISSGTGAQDPTSSLQSNGPKSQVILPRAAPKASLFSRPQRVKTSLSTQLLSPTSSP